jgi:hypothetical protein
MRRRKRNEKRNGTRFFQKQRVEIQYSRYRTLGSHALLGGGKEGPDGPIHQSQAKDYVSLCRCWQGRLHRASLRIQDSAKDGEEEMTPILNLPAERKNMTISISKANDNHFLALIESRSLEQGLLLVVHGLDGLAEMLKQETEKFYSVEAAQGNLVDYWEQEFKKGGTGGEKSQ